MTISSADNPTSYFSAPSNQLDPKLFQGRTLQDWVRKGILSLLHDYLGQQFRHSELWAHPWLAGSGVSYQWSAARQPGDLDCLIGVNFVQFRKANPEFMGLTDKEIADTLNEGFREYLQPLTEDWNGYELTFYVNPGGTDIRAIKPYAAYDLKYNEWTVTPDPNASAPSKPEWDAVAQNDYAMTQQVHSRFVSAMNDLTISRDPASKRNAEARLIAAGQQASAMFDELHSGRSEAFQPTGEGYGDFHNYRWQAAKGYGTIDALRSMREHMKKRTEQVHTELYGTELPDASTLIRRAALYRNSL